MSPRPAAHESVSASEQSSTKTQRYLERQWTGELAGAFATLLLIGSLAAWWTFSHGYSFYYGDAEAHLNIARRIVDTRTPGGYQIGTVWLPLPHILWAILAYSDVLWHSGLAGVIPSVAAFALAGTFLFAAARRVFDVQLAAWSVLLLFALNPNMLYLQSAPMTEAILAAAVAALLWATLWFRDTQSVPALLFAAAASNAASLTRYEGWFLIPFVALYFLIVAHRKLHAVLFGALAVVGPLAWLAHNQFYYSNALEFYNGPYSAAAIYQRQLASGMAPYPGRGDAWLAARQYLVAARDVVGLPLLLLGMAGIVIAIAVRAHRRSWWPLGFLALPALFYIWSIRSSATPIFVLSLPPFSLYNTRYAIPMLLLSAFGAGVLVDSMRWRGAIVRNLTLMVVAAAAGSQWGNILSGAPFSICWEEAEKGSAGRRQWTQQAAEALRSYKQGEGVLFSFGDMSGVLRSAGIPIREGLYQDNGIAWDRAVGQPEQFLQEKWALAVDGDLVDQTIPRAIAAGVPYRLQKQVAVDGEPLIKVYHRE